MKNIQVVDMETGRIYFEGDERECSRYLIENYPSIEIKKVKYKNQYIEDIIDHPIIRDPVYPEPLAKVKPN